MKKKKQQFIPELMDQIGEEIIYRSGKKSKEVKGTVTGIRHSVKTVVNIKTLKEYPAAELLIEPSDGKKSFWTGPFRNS